MVRFLVHCNEFDVEGLIATSLALGSNETHPEGIAEMIDLYEDVYPNLRQHAPQTHPYRQGELAARDQTWIDANVKHDHPQADEATLQVDAVSSAASVHVILEVTDDGSSSLTRYRRLVLDVLPASPASGRLSDP